MDQDQMLKGKRIIITGASSGIGKSLAKGLAEIGAKIGILNRSEGRLKEIVREIEDRGHKAVFALGDVQQSSQVQDGVTSLVIQLGGVDVLINNAGVMELNAIPKDYGEIDRILDTNLKGSLYCTLNGGLVKTEDLAKSIGRNKGEEIFSIYSTFGHFLVFDHC